VDKKKRVLAPALKERQALAEHLARILQALGLRRAPPKALAAYLTERAAASSTPIEAVALEASK
jgi:hypothetical protein